MITAVDTNILLDIFSDAPAFADKSARALRRQSTHGSLAAGGVVWAEAATFFEKPEDLLHTMDSIGIDFIKDSAETAIEAAKAWKLYKASGGKKEKLLPDFLIAAHALTQCDCLLTRDKGFYRNYFKGLKIIEP